MFCAENTCFFLNVRYDSKPMKVVKEIACLVLIVLLLDAVGIGWLFRDMWSEAIESVQHEAPQFRIVGAVLSYCFLIFGVYYFVYQHAESVYDCMLNGALFGLVVYGVFDATNFAIFKNYSVKASCIDVAWGMFVCSTSATLTFLLLGNQPMNSERITAPKPD